MDINNIKKIYMIGIKGVGMTMLAQFLHSKGKEVIGSDTNEVFMTDSILRGNGIKIIEGFDKNNIPGEVDLIIYSTAYNEQTNIEVEYAKKSKASMLTYAEALGEVFNAQHGIAVAGSHGKTTTSAWLGFVMDKAGLNPSVLVGSRVPQFGGCSINGVSDYMVIEADEYQNKLKHFNPNVILLNNIDYDHPDFFKTKEDYVQVFVDFIKKLPSKGFLVANFDDLSIKKHANVNCRGKVVSYAINDSADYVAYDIRDAGQKEYRQYFKVKFGVDSGSASTNDNLLGDFCIQLSGRHNIYNALAVIATSIEFGIDLVDIRKYLEEFSGTARRMELLGEFRGAKIVDDYGHHPTEIKTTIEGARKMYPQNRLIVVFHPHTFTRTKGLLDDFSKSFDLVDELIILDIYGSAREEQGGVHSKDLVKKIKSHQGKKTTTDIKYIPTLGECEAYLRDIIERDDVVLLIGAGDVFRIGENLVNN